MPRTYNVIDADGHVLEPVDMFDKYMDPGYRERAPRMIVDTDGKERLLIEGKVLGSKKGLGLLGAIGARQGDVSDLTMKYVDGRKGGFDPHARIVDLDLDGIDAAFLYPSVGLFAGAIQPPPLSRNPTRTRGKRSATPSQMMLIAASIISMVWEMMCRAPRVSKRSTPT